MKYLIVGLGNPGNEYENTRHNVGFMVLDQLASSLSTNFKQEKLGWVAEAKHKGRTLILLKPNTYMNLSGKAVNYWMQQYKIEPDKIMVVMDDVDLPFGSLRMRGKGSSAGHNGLKDIEEWLNSSKYPRLRFGIGKNFHKGEQIKYVMSPFNDEEKENLPENLQKAKDMCLAFAGVGLARAMNQYND